MRAPSRWISPAVGSISLRISLPAVDLPQPDSPTSPSVSPAVDRERYAVDGVDLGGGQPAEDALAHGKVLLEVFHLQDRRRAHDAAPSEPVGLPAGDPVAGGFLLQRRIGLPASRRRVRDSGARRCSRRWPPSATARRREFRPAGPCRCPRATSRGAARSRAAPACRGGAAWRTARRPAPLPPCGPHT